MPLDARLRAAARRFRATGALEDEVALLGERLRAGHLGRDRLRLAAALGHPAAARLTGPLPGAPSLPGRMRADEIPGPFLELIRWLLGLGQHVHERLVAPRAAAALARRSLPIWRACEPTSRGGRWDVDGALVALDVWIACPCAEHARRAKMAARRLAGIEEAIAYPAGAVGVAARDAARSVSRASQLPQILATAVFALGAAGVVPLAVEVDRDDEVDIEVEELIAGFDPGLYARVREAVAAELIPWALGRADPVRARLADAAMAS